MNSIRRVFLALAVVLLVSLAFLVRKAFESAASERSARHRAVAERVFDEMERELTSFLRAEESRPFEHYRHAYVPETATDGVAVRSPLAEIPRSDFILGYFQVHPDGSFSSPHRPEAGGGAFRKTSGAGRPFGSELAQAESSAWVDGLEEIVLLVWRLQEATATLHRTGSPQRENAGLQKAGSTVEVAPKAQAKKFPGESYLTYLNRGARSRDLRASKLEQTQAFNVGDLAEESRANERDADDSRQDRSAEILDVRLEPMVGRSAGAGILLLYRTVAIDQRAYRQGLLIDENALVDWLGRRVLSDGALAARAVFLADPSPASGPVPSPSTDFSGYTYRHRFAEPFGSVHGVLHFEELPELGGSADLVVLSLLLALTSTLGLFGLYRMVAVVVEFAERRHNFVSAVTHELKTPLTAIRMYGEMLRDGVVPDESKRQRYYETITAETERLTRLLQNVLELARLEKDTRTMNMTVGDAGRVIEEVVALLEPHASGKGFALKTEVEPDLPKVRYDRDALVQVLFNLVDNALKYARDAEPKEIVLGCRRDGDGVALTVADHGPGVAREHLGKIFEPFYRGENELTRRAKGTGIGLSLVRGLVERMGGRVLGRNTGARGFEVVVSLQVARAT